MTLSASSRRWTSIRLTGWPRRSDRYVRFATADGKTSVSVLARGGRLTLTERTTLDNLIGTNRWSADVSDQGKSTVDYAIGKDTSGTHRHHRHNQPASDVTALADVAKAKSVKTKFTGGWAVPTAGVTFTSDGWTKHLSISVSGKTDGTAALKTTLSGGATTEDHRHARAVRGSRGADLVRAPL